MAIEKLAPNVVSRTTKPGMYGDGGGLWLQVGRQGAKSWILRFTLRGRAREMGLGSCATYTLGEARERARAARQRIAEGVDPIEAKRIETERRRIESAKAVTFSQCADRYIAAHKASWSNPKHAAQWKTTLDTYALPHFGHLPVGEVDTAHVLAALEPIWTSKNETASRLRGRIESVLDYSRTRGFRTGENPARWKGHLSKLLARRSKVAKVAHHAALPFSAVPAFMADLAKQDGIAAKALAFTILTCARTGETIGATWDEVDLDAAVWTIPAKRMKAGQEHRVPLAAPAVAVLKQMQEIRIGDHVFPGARAGKPLSNMAMLALLGRMDRGGVTVHGFRSSFRDWAGDTTASPREVVEACLAHTVGDETERAYRRGDALAKRRELMESWAGFVTALPT